MTRPSDVPGWDPCSPEFPTCDPVNEGACHFHENILSQDCPAQFAFFKKALAAAPKSDWLIVVGHHPIEEVDVEARVLSTPKIPIAPVPSNSSQPRQCSI